MQFTQENRIRLRGTVFGKTAAGRAEVGQRSAGLTARQRSVLIMLDGQKSLADIGPLVGEDEMLAAVEGLLRKGLVGISSAPASAAAVAKPEPPALSPRAAGVGAAALAAARDLMAVAARQHLGLLAADLVRRIEHAKDESQLAGVIGLWHVSIRESKTGKPCAEDLLAEARALLA
ncbi:hypothetical protein GM658_24885 [Pseudoduganella eburnea]|uniref:Uncharacterized protein n=1 Tax=Massilia eburnea TaxID=1776165 RepID=A0A6L6QQN7_9BURK|nr:hypothetical protein [Massilia eburnea]MTW13853.1 hypothetical protein [Massilia eburnea]